MNKILKEISDAIDENDRKELGTGEVPRKGDLFSVDIEKLCRTLLGKKQRLTFQSENKILGRTL